MRTVCIAEVLSSKHSLMQKIHPYASSSLLSHAGSSAIRSVNELPRSPPATSESVYTHQHSIPVQQDPTGHNSHGDRYSPASRKTRVHSSTPARSHLPPHIKHRHKPQHPLLLLLLLRLRRCDLPASSSLRRHSPPGPTSVCVRKRGGVLRLVSRLHLRVGCCFDVSAGGGGRAGAGAGVRFGWGPYLTGSGDAMAFFGRGDWCGVVGGVRAMETQADTRVIYLRNAWRSCTRPHDKCTKRPRVQHRVEGWSGRCWYISGVVDRAGLKHAEASRIVSGFGVGRLDFCDRRTGCLFAGSDRTGCGLLLCGVEWGEWSSLAAAALSG